MVLSAHGSPNFGKKINLQLFCYRHHFQNFYILKLVFKVFFLRFKRPFVHLLQKSFILICHIIYQYICFSPSSHVPFYLFFMVVSCQQVIILQEWIWQTAILFLLFKNWNNEYVLIFSVFQSGIVNICVLTG